MAKSSIKVALIGNPNTGKTSLLNALTGLSQKVGNYPEITVEEKVEQSCLCNDYKAHIIDLPGTYSPNASSEDEHVAVNILLNHKGERFPDVVVVVCDVNSLKQNLLIFTQIKDLHLPTLLVISMTDQIERKGISIDTDALEQSLSTKVALTSTHTGEEIETLKRAIKAYEQLPVTPCVAVERLGKAYFDHLSSLFPNENIYKL